MENENEKKEEKKSLSKPMKEKGEHRVHIIKVYLNDEEIKEVENFASVYGRSRSTILRESFFKTFEEAPSGKGKYQPDTALVRAVSRVGINLNQIARQINTIAKAKDFADVIAIQSDVEDMKKILEEIKETKQKKKGVDDAS